MTTLPVSIIILTERNDETFHSSLRSAQIADEVLIVDNNSGNDWKELKKKFRFSLITRHDTISDFSAVRNEAAAYARHEWLFFLDSDEVLDSHAVSHVAQCIASPEVNGWYVARKDYFLGKAINHGETAHLSFLRLYRKGTGHFKGAVHETCVVAGKTSTSKLILHHTPHSSIADFLITICRYAQMVPTTRESKSTLILKLVFFPPAKFIHNYLLKLGFLDGYRGLIYAMMMSLHSFFVRVYTYEHKK